MFKQKIKWIYFLFVGFAFLVLGLISCGKVNYDIFKNNLSEVRYNYFSGSVGEYLVTFTSGMREVDFKLNGVHTENVEFGILSITLPKDVEFVSSANYKLEYGNKLISGSLEQNPFDLTLIVDIGFIINDVDEMKVTFKMGDITKYITIKDVTKNFKLNYEDALNLFVESNYTQLEKFIVKGELQAEVYVKIMYDTTVDSNYYYLIRVLGRTGETLSGIINPITGELLAVTNGKI